MLSLGLRTAETKSRQGRGSTTQLPMNLGSGALGKAEESAAFREFFMFGAFHEYELLGWILALMSK